MKSVPYAWSASIIVCNLCNNICFITRNVDLALANISQLDGVPCFYKKVQACTHTVIKSKRVGVSETEGETQGDSSGEIGPLSGTPAELMPRMLLTTQISAEMYTALFVERMQLGFNQNICYCYFNILVFLVASCKYWTNSYLVMFVLPAPTAKWICFCCFLVEKEGCQDQFLSETGHISFDLADLAQVGQMCANDPNQTTHNNTFCIYNNSASIPGHG